MQCIEQKEELKKYISFYQRYNTQLSFTEKRQLKSYLNILDNFIQMSMKQSAVIESIYTKYIEEDTSDSDQTQDVLASEKTQKSQDSNLSKNVSTKTHNTQTSNTPSVNRKRVSDKDLLMNYVIYGNKKNSGGSKE